jgi:hypothetical protein
MSLTVQRAHRSEVVVATELLVPAQLPDVSAASGAQPARPVQVVARSKPWWPWLLLLAGWIGVLLLVFFYDRMCERRRVWLPLTHDDVERAARRTHRAWAGFGLGVALVIVAILWALVGPVSGGVPVVALLVGGTVLAGLALVVSTRVVQPVRMTLQAGGEKVVLHAVHPDFVAELDRRWS